MLIEHACLNNPTGSSDEKAKKKRRSFFNFRRSAKRDSHKKGETVPWQTANSAVTPAVASAGSGAVNALQTDSKGETSSSSNGKVVSKNNKVWKNRLLSGRGVFGRLATIYESPVPSFTPRIFPKVPSNSNTRAHKRIQSFLAKDGATPIPVR